MPRSGSLATVNQDDLTPFGHLLYDYLLSFKPTKTVPEFARDVGVSTQAVWDWLRARTVPRRATLVLISERTDLPLDELLRAAGLPSTEEVRRARREHLGMLHASIDEVMALVRADPEFTDADIAIIERFLRKKPGDFIMATDTWREYHHESPTVFAAQQAEERAEVFDPEPAPQPHPTHPKRRHDTGQNQQVSRNTGG